MIFNNMATNWQLGFQIPATPIAEGIDNLHNLIMKYVIFILIFVSYMLYRSLTLFHYEKNSTPYIFNHSAILEFIWTIIPCFILVAIAIPSFALLYSSDELLEPDLTVKVIGRQWYWTYEMYNSDGGALSIDSYYVPDADLAAYEFRLLSTNGPLFLPIETNIRLLITSSDVIHSFAIPSFGVKVDAVPGRINQTMIYVKNSGTFYGQCSEICGQFHGFTPIEFVCFDSALEN
jgi:cytochrome c oxidase subunit 2